VLRVRSGRGPTLRTARRGTASTWIEQATGPIYPSRRACSRIGFFERVLSTLTLRLVHPTSPALLTRNGPLVFFSFEIKSQIKYFVISHVFKV